MRPGWAVVALSTTLVACGADLDREAGTVVVTVSGVEARADRIELRVFGDDIEDYVVRLEVSGTQVEHTIESVPARDVNLSVIATEAGARIASASSALRVRANTVNAVTLDLGVADDAVLSNALAFTTTVLPSDLTDGALDVRVPLDGAAWSSFIADATAQLQQAPGSFELRTMQISVLPTSVELEGIDDLWDDDALGVRLVGPGPGAEVLVASLELEEDANPVLIPLGSGATNLAPLTASLAQGDVVVELFGPSGRSREDTFRGELELVVVFAALP